MSSVYSTNFYTIFKVHFNSNLFDLNGKYKAFYCHFATYFAALEAQMLFNQMK